MKRISLIVALSIMGLSMAPQLAQANQSNYQRAAEAEAVWQSIAQEQPRNAIAHYNLGIALGNQGKWAEAIAAYQTATELDSQLTVAYINLGRALTETQQLQAAGEAYKTALKLEPTQQLAQERLSQLQGQSGNIAINEAIN